MQATGGYGESLYFEKLSSIEEVCCALPIGS